VLPPTELVAAVLALLAALCVGTVVHELLHAGILRAAGASVEIHWGSDGRSDRHWAAITGSLAAVRLRGVPPALSPWHLRVASLAPLVLAAPLLLIAVGVVPDPFSGTDYVVQFALIGWLACALPSPQDFSVCWHATDVVDAGTPAATGDGR